MEAGNVSVQPVSPRAEWNGWQVMSQYSWCLGGRSRMEAGNVSVQPVSPTTEWNGWQVMSHYSWYLRRRSGMKDR